MEEVHQNPFLNVREAGAVLRLKKRTLDNMRWMGTGPHFRQHGGRVSFFAAERSSRVIFAAPDIACLLTKTTGH